MIIIARFNLLSFSKPHQLFNSWSFLFYFRHADEVWNANYSTSSIWDFVEAVRLPSKILVPPICFPSISHNHDFTSLVYTRDLLTRHPNALELINSLPASQGQCFKPEAELVLQKYNSLKTENRRQFTANVKTHFEGRNTQPVWLLSMTLNLSNT